jgi:3-oxoisoapionate kinase
MSGRPLLAYYGDDLTGSTDVMEALSTRGISTVLFTATPDDARMTRFPGRKAVGIAGSSRSETPDWMDRNLPEVFEWMKASGAELCHYKVCSTFDSGPEVGSIGRAIDIGAKVFGQAVTPLVVGAPELKRYTAFGHLFAHFGPDIFRIDRHPVMSRHPVTPMDEADLRLHLARQTRKSIGLVDFLTLKRHLQPEELAQLVGDHGVVLFDVLDEETKAEAGRHLWSLRGASPFVAGSSGVEYALVAPGSETPLSGGTASYPRPGTRGPIAVVSGSCSATTERQIHAALKSGFAGIALDGKRLIEGDEAAMADAVRKASAALAAGRSPLIYTALGVPEGGIDEGAGGHGIGRGLGRIMAELVKHHGLKRVVVAGGDTSSHAMRELSIQALELLVPLPACPGSPLCKAWRGAAMDGELEVAFKGGQVGTEDYFIIVRDI